MTACPKLYKKKYLKCNFISINHNTCVFIVARIHILFHLLGIIWIHKKSPLTLSIQLGAFCTDFNTRSLISVYIHICINASAISHTICIYLCTVHILWNSFYSAHVSYMQKPPLMYVWYGLTHETVQRCSRLPNR